MVDVDDLAGFWVNEEIFGECCSGGVPMSDIRDQGAFLDRKSTFCNAASCYTESTMDRFKWF